MVIRSLSDILRDFSFNFEAFWLCTVCQFDFPSFDEWTVHLRNAHLYSNEPGYPCVHCPDHFNLPHELAIHMYQLHMKMKFRCRVCFDEFETHDDLEHTCNPHCLECNHLGCMNDEETAEYWSIWEDYFDPDN